jgi:hypothetical protein
MSLPVPARWWKKEFSAEMIVYLKDKDGTQLSEKTFGNLKLFSPEGFELAKQVLKGIEVPATRIQYFPFNRSTWKYRGAGSTISP